MAETQFVMDGQTDEWTDGAILICLPKFLRGHKNLDPSYKMDLDLWDCLGWVKLTL